MNFKTVCHYVGLVLRLEALFLLPPLFLALYLSEFEVVRAFLVSAVIMVSISLALAAVGQKDTKIHLRESFVVVAVSWIAMSLFGAFPFWLSGEIPSLVDALFESMSGFTTTGVSILGDIEAMSTGLLFWRSFTHWIGGMGVLVFLIAVVPFVSGERNLSVMKAESPGPAPGKLVPKLRQSSKILYGIYVGLTILCFLFLLAGGMPLFDSAVNALSTAGTGGLAVTNASIAAYDSLYIEMVVSVFMLLFGVNFNIFYFLLIRNFAGIRASDELRCYGGVVVAATLVIGCNLLGSVYSTFGESLRYAFFQVSSVISTTGFATADYSLWPGLSQGILLLLTLTGACAGSTSGGMKLSRMVIALRYAKLRLRRLIAPRSVHVVKMDGKVVDRQIIHGVGTYMMAYLLLFALSTMLVALDNFDFATTFTSVLTCLSNVGPGLGKVSASGNFSEFSSLSKLVLAANMLLGRLEIYPVLLLFAPYTWRKMS